MNYTIGKKYLITVDDWFYAPDGKQYHAVFGTIQGFHNSLETLGIKVNIRSADWYMSIGNGNTMSIAGCRIHYAIRTDSYVEQPVDGTEYNTGGIFNADHSDSDNIYNEVMPMDSPLNFSNTAKENNKL